VIGDLLHRLYFHGDVKPVDDVGCGFWHHSGQALQDFSAIRNHGNVAKAAIPPPAASSTLISRAASILAE
jgi:hypothetical protein